MNAPLTAVPTQTDDLIRLCEAVEAAKQDMDRARARYSELEQALIETVGVQDEGSHSVTVDDRYKVTTTGRVNRSIDSDGLSAAWHELPEPVQQAFRWKADVNIKQLRSLASLRDDIYPMAARFITAKPGKPSLKLEPAKR